MGMKPSPRLAKYGLKTCIGWMKPDFHGARPLSMPSQTRASQHLTKNDPISAWWFVPTVLEETVFHCG